MLTSAPRPHIETIPDDVLCDGWRHALSTIDERLFFARQDLRLERRIDALTLEIYRAAVKRVSEAEAEMDRRGLEYAREHDWIDDPLLVAAVACEAMGAF